MQPPHLGIRICRGRSNWLHLLCCAQSSKLFQLWFSFLHAACHSSSIWAILFLARSIIASLSRIWTATSTSCASFCARLRVARRALDLNALEVPHHGQSLLQRGSGFNNPGVWIHPDKKTGSFPRSRAAASSTFVAQSSGPNAANSSRVTDFTRSSSSNVPALERPSNVVWQSWPRRCWWAWTSQDLDPSGTRETMHGAASLAAADRCTERKQDVRTIHPEQPTQQLSVTALSRFVQDGVTFNNFLETECVGTLELTKTKILLAQMCCCPAPHSNALPCPSRVPATNVSLTRWSHCQRVVHVHPNADVQFRVRKHTRIAFILRRCSQAQHGHAHLPHHTSGGHPSESSGSTLQVVARATVLLRGLQL